MYVCEIYIYILTERPGLVRGANILDSVQVAGDDGVVDAVANQRQVPHFGGDDDWLGHLVHALLHVDGVALWAAARGGLDGVGDRGVAAAAIQRHHAPRQPPVLRYEAPSQTISRLAR